MRSIIYILYILLLFFGIIHNQDCEQIIANSRSDCSTFSSSNNYCCFNSIGSSCKLVPKNELNKYNYDCGITGDNYGKYDFQQYHPQIGNSLGFQTCGKKKPLNPKDCHEYSDIGNNCCYFDYNETKACYYIGREVDKKKKKSSYGNINFDCFSSNVIFNSYLIILILFIL